MAEQEEIVHSGFRAALVTAWLVVTAAQSSLYAGLISSFETGLDGWVPNDDTVMLSQDTTGATDGTSSLQVVRTTSMWNNTMKLDPANLLQFQNPFGVLMFDVTANPQDVPAMWLNITPVINSQAKNWQQGPDIHIMLDGMPHTYIWDFSSLDRPAPGSGWFQIWLPSNAGDVATYYLDNIRTAIPGDANLDDNVNFSDLLTVARNYGTTDGATWGQGDFNGDGAVDFTDLLIVARHYGQSAPTAGQMAQFSPAFAAGVAAAFAQVPEPSCAVLLLFGALPRRRRPVG